MTELSEWIRCKKMSAKEIGRLGMTEADALVERWKCSRCGKRFLVDYHPEGSAYWVDAEYEWASIPKARKGE